MILNSNLGMPDVCWEILWPFQQENRTEISPCHHSHQMGFYYSVYLISDLTLLLKNTLCMISVHLHFLRFILWYLSKCSLCIRREYMFCWWVSDKCQFGEVGWCCSCLVILSLLVLPINVKVVLKCTIKSMYWFSYQF